jgi:localization factor PodJL
VEKNFAESYKWFALAAAQGDKEAAKKRDEVAARMDAGALAAAQAAVKVWAAEPQPEPAANVPVPPGGWDRSPSGPAPAAKQGSAAAYRVGTR